MLGLNNRGHQLPRLCFERSQTIHTKACLDLVFVDAFHEALYAGTILSFTLLTGPAVHDQLLLIISLE